MLFITQWKLILLNYVVNANTDFCKFCLVNPQDNLEATQQKILRLPQQIVHNCHQFEAYDRKEIATFLAESCTLLLEDLQCKDIAFCWLSAYDLQTIAQREALAYWIKIYQNVRFLEEEYCGTATWGIKQLQYLSSTAFGLLLVSSRLQTKQNSNSTQYLLWFRSSLSR